MGRLENFIPMVRKLNFESRDHKLYVTATGHQAISVPPRLLPFLKNLNGHLSLREIMLFLNKKNERIYIKDSLLALEKLAERGFLVNGADFLRAYHNPANEAGTQRSSPFQSHLNAAYFSNERLIGLLQKTTLFMKCDRKVAEQILRHGELEHHAENTRIIKKGTKSRHFYVLLAGEVGVFKRGNLLANLGTLTVFGESAAIFDRERNADVSTISDCWLLKIDATGLMDVKATENFEFMNSLRSRLILNQMIAANPLFRDVPSDILQLFLSKCRIEKHAKEREIIRQGDTHGEFYFILKGSVTIIRDGIPITSLGEGEHFGEVAAIFHEPRTASVITESECVFLTMTHQSLMEVLASHFRLAMDIEKTAAERKESTENIFTKISEDLTASGFFDGTDLGTHIQIDDSFIEITETNFDMKVYDFTKQTGEFELESPDDSEEAS